MSRALCQVFSHQGCTHFGGARKTGQIFKNDIVNAKLTSVQIAYYSKRNNAEDLADSYKVVKSKVRMDDDINSLEGGPNWELLSPRGNRFFFPNLTGPAWQGATTTIHMEAPLSWLVNFDKKGSADNNKLEFKITDCPALIKDSLHELFPAPEVITNRKLTLLLLSFDGDIEMGAEKFVLAAREISERLRLHGFWADFMNPFSGKPFFSWSNGKHLYKVDERFRGINMKLTNRNSCTVISAEENPFSKFSGSIYTTATSDFKEFIKILEERLRGCHENV